MKSSSWKWLSPRKESQMRSITHAHTHAHMHQPLTNTLSRLFSHISSQWKQPINAQKSSGAAQNMRQTKRKRERKAQGETKPWLCFQTKTAKEHRINSEQEQRWGNKTRNVSLKSTAERVREREGEMGWAVTALQQAAHNFSLLRLFN